MSSSSMRKAARYLQLLETALTNGNHHEVPELSRKVRKHDRSRTCFAKSAEVQALLLQRLARRQRSIDELNLNDTKGEFHWLQLGTQELGDEKVLLEQAYASHNEASPHDQAYYDVTNLFYGIVSQQLHAAAELASKINASAQNPVSTQSTVLLGILDELLGQRSNAVYQYEIVANVQNTAKTQNQAVWHEHAVYRLAVLAPCSTNYERYTALRSSKDNTPDARYLHVLSCYPQSAAYQKELFRNSKFPTAEVTNIRLLDQVSHTMESWIASDLGTSDAEKHLDMLHEAATKTFHSPRLLRYMVYVLAALGRYDEMMLALKAYLQIAVHAQKTRPAADVDSPQQIVTTVHFVVCRALRDAPQHWRAEEHATEILLKIEKFANDLQVTEEIVLGMINEIHGSVSLLRYTVTYEDEHLDTSIAFFDSANKTCPSSRLSKDLAIAHVLRDEIPAAMMHVRQALQTEQSSVEALLVFANLLTCEEKFDRAWIVLEKIFDTAHTNNHRTIRQSTLLVHARILQNKIEEALRGANKALESTPILFSAFSTYFPTTANAAQNQTTQTASEIRDNFNTNTNGPMTMNAPSIQVDSPHDSRSAKHTANANGFRSAPTSTHLTNISPPNGASRMGTNPVRSSSLKLSHPQMHLGHHLHLRKSASTRSFRSRSQTPNESSSRASSPLNHPAPSVRSLFPGVPDEQNDVDSDSQITAAAMQDHRKNKLLSETWLYIADLCRASGAPMADAKQAIEEARLLVGQTSRIITLQLEQRLILALAHGSITETDYDTIEQGYEFALNLDDDDETTILSFADFLMRDETLPSMTEDITYSTEEREAKLDGRLARAYELLESLKLSPAASNPKLWQLSADVAMRRGEEERAEAEYWRAIRVSDCRGLLDWRLLW